MHFFSPRRVLALAVVALGLLAAQSAQAYPYQPIRGTQLFAPDSVWNKPLAADAPLTSNSSTLSGTLNWEQADDGMDLDYVPGEARALDVNGKPPVAISDSFGFGGHNAVICIRGTAA